MHDRLSAEEEMLAARSLMELSDAELERWTLACLRRQRSATGSWFLRWVWRRRWRRAKQAISERTLARLGPGPALCERCQGARPTVHRVYEKGAHERHGHFCSACSELEPSGRCGVFEAGA